MDKPEIKTSVINGVKIVFQKCWNAADKKCKGWFIQNNLGTNGRKDSCSQYCAVRKCKSWQTRNENKAKTSK